MKLSDSIEALPGIGPKKAARFSALGIRTIRDLLSYFPRAYEDRTVRRTIARLQPGEPACFEAVVVSPPKTAHIRRGLDITHVVVSDHSGQLKLTFFNQKYVVSALHYGEEYLFYGEINGGLIGTDMTNPSFEPLRQAGATTDCILPVYPLTEGLSNNAVRKAVEAALAGCLDQLKESLPLSCVARHHLVDPKTAYHDIHCPPSFEALEAARRRLVFEEFFLFSCGLFLLRHRRRSFHRPPMTDTDPASFLSLLPFTPTKAQRRAIEEILTDFRRSVPMNRLLQGDVGSGKTVVAAAAMSCTARNGLQSALMAPTEILAEQHFSTLSPLFSRLGISCALLTGSTPAVRRREIKAALADGSCRIVIGTHALFSKDVHYRRLGLVVTDEQHRFGVGQRAALSEKGEHPHLLVMSATPIPRTLALILYGDLDISTLDEKPAGRQNIDTFLVGESMRARVNAFIRKQVAQGQQAYIVCPAIEEGETGSLKSARLFSETLQKTVFSDLRVGLLHGQMKGAEKDAVMSAFARGEYDILVATTVVEVGVDVPNATLMVIENADRFGLSQLHQLRGRVGRGNAKSYCILFSEQKNPETLRRLQTLTKTNDGFAIAEEDLSLRGPGDFFGSRQHGTPLFRAASMTSDLSILTEARQAAEEYLSSSPSAHDSKPLRDRISALFSDNFSALN